MRIITKWLLIAIALLLVARIVPGVSVENLYTALIVAFLIGLLNVIIRPFILLLTLPITILTLGLFTFVVNALLFWFVASFVDGFTVEGFAAAFWGALIVSAVSFLGSRMLDREDEGKHITYSE